LNAAATYKPTLATTRTLKRLKHRNVHLCNSFTTLYQEKTMIEIILGLEGNNRTILEVPFGLFTVPAVTGMDDAPSDFGQWFCSSPLVGRNLAGKYYRKQAITTCSREQDWAINCNSMRGPYAFFLDSTDRKAPFMVLYDFRPYSNRDTYQRHGLLRRSMSAEYAHLAQWTYAEGS